MTNGPSRPTSLACTLAAGDLRQRRAWIARLNRDALRSAFRDGLRLELTYSRRTKSRPEVGRARTGLLCVSDLRPATGRRGGTTGHRGARERPPCARCRVRKLPRTCKSTARLDRPQAGCDRRAGRPRLHWATAAFQAFVEGCLGASSPIRRVVSHRLQSAETGHWHGQRGSTLKRRWTAKRFDNPTSPEPETPGVYSLV